uniref:Fiber protein Fb15 n=1 Tax=Solanum tuberosum TaxID=4113 RepID=M1CII1_SOLTU
MALRNLYKEMKGLKLKEKSDVTSSTNSTAADIDCRSDFLRLMNTAKDKHLSLLVAFTLFSVIGVPSFVPCS